MGFFTRGAQKRIAGSPAPCGRALCGKLKFETVPVIPLPVGKRSSTTDRINILRDHPKEVVLESHRCCMEPRREVVIENEAVGLNSLRQEASARGFRLQIVNVRLIVRVGSSKGPIENVFD